MAEDVFTETTVENKTPVDNTEAVALKKRFEDSQTYIAKLEAENKKYREDGLRADVTNKAIEELKQELLNKNTQNENKEENTTPSLSREEILGLVRSSITVVETEKSANQNRETVNISLVKQFGTLDKAKEAVQVRAKELGLPVSELVKIAEKSPTAFQKMLDVPQSRSNDAQMKSAVNTQTTLPNQGANPGTKEFYDNIRKSNPKEYWTPRVQNAIMAAVTAGTYSLEG